MYTIVNTLNGFPLSFNFFAKNISAKLLRLEKEGYNLNNVSVVSSANEQFEPTGFEWLEDYTLYG